MEKLFSNEIVFKGHPDKVADQISDKILVEYLKKDPNSRVAVETVGGKGIIFVTGEITSKAKVDIPATVKSVLKDVGYSTNYKVIDNTGQQSPDISQGVNVGGAGDNGMMFGYACNETPQKLPKAVVILQEFSKFYDELRKQDTRFLSDGKAMLTGVYNGKGSLLRIKTATVCYQNTEVEREYTDSILKAKLTEIANKYNIEIEEFLFNPTGKFLIGGFEGDSGLTGRKIVVDSYHGFAPVGGGAFCVDNQTEYLTPEGWKHIDDYQGGKVAQWNDGKLEFVNPEAYIECDAKDMYHIKSPTAFNMVLSDKHDLVLKTSKGNIIKKQLRTLLDENNNIKNGNSGDVPMYFDYDLSHNKGVNLTDDEIRLQVAFSADGTILNGKNTKGRVRVKKQCKIDRLKLLLKNTNTDYSIFYDNEYSIFLFNPPVVSKTLSEVLANVNQSQALVLAEEVFKWDGNEDKSTFRTTHKHEADFIQFILMSVTGKRVSILVDRVGEIMSSGHIRKSTCYEVTVCKNKYSTLRHDTTNKLKITIEPFTPDDGKMYCFTVDSGMLILRRDDKVFITGNSGKDPTKVDRSGAYKAREIAKRVLEEKDLEWCQVQVAYAIGIVEPLSIYISSNIGEIEPDPEMYKEFIVKRMIKDLKLLEVDYVDMAAFGHFKD